MTLSTYQVRFVLKENRYGQPRWFAIDHNGDWRAYCDAGNCKGQEGMELASSLFHPEEIESVSFGIDGSTFARIRKFS